MVAARQSVPEPWAAAPVVEVGDGHLTDPVAVVERLHRLWLERRPVVVRLSADPEALRAPEICQAAPYTLTPSFDLWRERLQFLVWANNYDARRQELIWWHGRRAARLLAATGAVAGGPADLVLGDGTPVYVDGGPAPAPAMADSTAVLHRTNVDVGSSRLAGPAATVGALSGAAAHLGGLAPDQLAAVTHRPGPARIVAPAGSGKTRVLTERLRHLLRDRGVDPRALTAVAFNTRAAQELRDRCVDVADRPGPHIRTIHSLAFSICSAAVPGLRVAHEPEVREVLDTVFPIRHQRNTDPAATYLQALALVRLGLVAPDDAEASIPEAAGLAAGFERFRAVLAERRAVDFDEQIYQAVELLLRQPDLRQRAQRSCRFLLVDEMQDVNPAHLLLLRLVNAPGFDCFGVGDDDQVIYGYAGATPEFLIHFDRYFPGAAHHQLHTNYRCPPAVVHAASQLLRHNRRRIPKEITAAGTAHPEDAADALRTLVAPADQLAPTALSVVEGWLAESHPPSAIAVLARVNAALLPVQVACSVAGVPCEQPLGPEVLQRTGIRSALAYLRIGVDPGRIAASDLLETLRRPSRRLARNVVEMLTRRRFTSLADVDRLASRLSGGDVDKLRSYLHDLEAVAAACARSCGEALRLVRDQIGLGEAVDALDASRPGVERSCHGDDLAALASVAALHPEAASFERWLRQVLAPASPPSAAVTLSTVHKMKGREWDRVLVFDVSQGVVPHRLADDLEEERRILHVALTRARRQLVVLSDVAAPSPLLDELLGRIPAAGSARPAAGGGGRPVSGARRRRGASAAPGTARGASGGAGAADGGAADGGAANGEDEAVDARFEALRRWRREEAARQDVPAYVVLNDQHLRGIARRRPTTLRQLAGCPGIGPTRLERYGDDILAALDQETSSPG